MWLPKLRDMSQRGAWLLFWNAVNLVLLLVTLAHRSTEPQILGRYTRAYAVGAGLAVLIATVVLALSLYAWRKPERKLLEVSLYVPGWLWAVLVLASMLIVSVIPAGEQIKVFILVNLGLFGGSVAAANPTAAPGRRMFIGLFCGLLLIAILGLNLAVAGHTPGEMSNGDEAAYLSYAKTWLRTGNLYYEFAGDPPLPIMPGYSYSVTALADWIRVFGSSFFALRAFTWLLYAGGVASIGVAAWQLYDRPTALIAMLAAAASPLFLAYRLVRPEVGLPIGGGLALACYAASRKRPWWGALCGIIACASLDFHSAGIAYVVSMVGLYFTDWLLDLRRRRSPFGRRYVAFAVGLLLGGSVYALLHILILPQPGYFFAYLGQERNFIGIPLTNFPGLIADRIAKFFTYYRETSLSEILLLFVGLLAMMARRREQDGWLLRGLAFLAVGYVFIVPPRVGLGYLTLFTPYFALSLAALARDGLSRQPIIQGDGNRWLWQSSLVVGLCGLYVGNIGPGAFPLTSDEHSFEKSVVDHVRGLVGPDTVVLGNPQAYWVFNDHLHFYNLDQYWVKLAYQEYLASQHIGGPRLTEARTVEEGWEELKPDVIFHIRYPHFPTLFPDLIKYMQTKNYVLVETLDTGSYPVDIWFRPGYVPPGRSGSSYNGLLTAPG